ncbi:MAG: FAD-dependent oxidoreductase [Rhodospirillales bacterium]|nr:FAD-dependent oxidoreductase [Rhodospirillales bacterium]
MPRNLAKTTPPSLSIAVIGSGVAGLSAAWLLSQRHRVTLFEKDGRLGGHTNTVDISCDDGRHIAVDTGFIVYNECNYPNLTALFRHLGIATEASNMSFSVSMDDGHLEYAGSDLKGLFAQPSNVLRPRFWRMLRDILRFYRYGPDVLNMADAATLTLGAYLDRCNYSEAFIDDHLLPMAAAIWSTPAGDMRMHPARAFVQFCMAHGLMRVSGRPQWRTVTGGAREYIKILSEPYADGIRLNACVRRIHRVDAGVVVEETNGTKTAFDRVVVATHADQALRLLADPSRDEQDLLSAFRYARNRAILHSDRRLMPKRRAAWSSWNYLGERRSPGERAISVTYWMNRLQNIDERYPLFVTLNPIRPPQAEHVIAAFDYSHPTFDHRALAAQTALAQLSGHRSTWYCGSYFGAGFHEDALVSGLNAAEASGGVARPWMAPAAGQDQSQGAAVEPRAAA